MRRHGRGAGVGRALGVGVGLGVELAVAVGVAVAVAVAVAVTVEVGVGVGLGPAAPYLPPVLSPRAVRSRPPQTIISLFVHTAVCSYRPDGALLVQVGTQLSVPGL